MPDKNLINEWLRQLYQDAIDEATSSIANERLWANGSDGDAREAHLANAENLEEYVRVLGTKLEEIPA